MSDLLVIEFKTEAEAEEYGSACSGCRRNI